MHKSRYSHFLYALFIFLAAGWGNLGMAQRVPVVEAGGESTAANDPGTVAGSSNDNNEIMVNMYLQLEALQQEVQNLRGLVEEQSYQIRRMETQQRDRYIDVDSRLSALAGEIQAMRDNPLVLSQEAGNQEGTTGLKNRPAPVSPTLIPPVVPADEPGAESPQTGPALATGPQNDQELYRNALNLLLEQSEYEESATQFQQYIEIYSDGRYLTNALYWLGEALILLERYPQAEEVFTRVIEEFPADPKAPGAMLKLGVVYDLMGNTAQAVETWNQISSRYPDSSSEIRYANDYLSQAGN